MARGDNELSRAPTGGTRLSDVAQRLLDVIGPAQPNWFQLDPASIALEKPGVFATAAEPLPG